MDELDAKIVAAFTWKLVNKELTSEVQTDVNVDAIKQAFKDAGYVHIPTSKGRNVTVYTSDNDEPLMTEQEWREKFNG